MIMKPGYPALPPTQFFWLAACVVRSIETRINRLSRRDATRGSSADSGVLATEVHGFAGIQSDLSVKLAQSIV